MKNDINETCESELIGKHEKRYSYKYTSIHSKSDHYLFLFLCFFGAVIGVGVFALLVTFVTGY